AVSEAALEHLRGTVRAVAVDAILETEVADLLAHESERGLRPLGFGEVAPRSDELGDLGRPGRLGLDESVRPLRHRAPGLEIGQLRRRRGVEPGGDVRLPGDGRRRVPIPAILMEPVDEALFGRLRSRAKPQL